MPVFSNEALLRCLATPTEEFTEPLPWQSQTGMTSTEKLGAVPDNPLWGLS